MSKIISTAKSVCPVCLRVIEAHRTVGDDGNIYLEKTCPEHGRFSVLIWEGGMEEYNSWGKSDAGGDCVAFPVPVKNGCPYDCGLCSEHRSNGCCVLLELTNRCNLKCPVCFAGAGEKKPYDLPMEKIEAQYDMLLKKGGPFNIQLSGGEPTMRNDLPEIIELGRRKGFSFFQLNTNGIRLADTGEYAKQLKAAGLNCVFLQFDGFDDHVFYALRGKMFLDTKIRAIDNCVAACLGVVLVPVIAPEINLDSIGRLLQFAMERMPYIRGVHFQPVSYFGRCALKNSVWRITIPRMLHEIERQTNGLMKWEDFGGGGAENPYCSFHASYMRLPDGTFRALSRRRSQCCCVKASETREFVASQWSGQNKCCAEKNTDCCTPQHEENNMEETTSLDEFLEMAKEHTFTVSGMLFQDAYNLDLDRLRRCYLCEADSSRGMVPFCAYNLTDCNGKALYRK